MKFSADKLDTMIVQAISLLDDIDKELNNYVMRCKEWYGWHFPELSSIVNDGVKYAQVIKLMGIFMVYGLYVYINLGVKENAAESDLSSIFTDETTIQAIKSSAEVSIGTEVIEIGV